MVVSEEQKQSQDQSPLLHFLEIIKLLRKGCFQPPHRHRHFQSNTVVTDITVRIQNTCCYLMVT